MEDGKSIGNTLEMHPSGRNESPTTVVVDKSSKIILCDDNEECKEQLRDHLVANEKAIQIPAKNDCCVKDSTKIKDSLRGSGACAKKRWKNHILFQHNEEQENVILLDDHLNLCEALRSKDTSKWETTMQKGYDLLMAN